VEQANDPSWILGQSVPNYDMRLTVDQVRRAGLAGVMIRCASSARWLTGVLPAATGNTPGRRW
jgi:hypothetical protein